MLPKWLSDNTETLKSEEAPTVIGVGLDCQTRDGEAEEGCGETRIQTRK